MQIFEITARRNESAVKGMDTVVAPTKPRAPANSAAPGWDYNSALKSAGIGNKPTAPAPAPATGGAPGWDYASAAKLAGIGNKPAAPAPTTPVGQQPEMSLGDKATVAGGKLARSAGQGVNVLGGIANSLGSQILTKAGLPGDLGAAGSQNPFGNKEAQARKVAEKGNKTLADQLYKQWTAASTKNAPNTPAMQQSLNNIISQTLLRGRSPTDFGRYISKDKSQEVAAQLQKMNQSQRALASKNAQMTYQDWYNLVSATSELNHLMAFWPQKYGGVEMRKDGKFYANGMPLNLTDPEDLAVLQNAMARQEIRMPEETNIADVNKQVQAAAAQTQGQTAK